LDDFFLWKKLNPDVRVWDRNENQIGSKIKNFDTTEWFLQVKIECSISLHNEGTGQYFASHYEGF
jgi:hypothetical protein